MKECATLPELLEKEFETPEKKYETGNARKENRVADYLNPHIKNKEYTFPQGE